MCPTYSYQCKCGYTKEEFLFLSQRDNPQECPKCGKRMIRLIGCGGGFILKGDGFYCNAYPKDKEK